MSRTKLRYFIAPTGWILENKLASLPLRSAALPQEQGYSCLLCTVAVLFDIKIVRWPTQWEPMLLRCVSCLLLRGSLIGAHYRFVRLA